MDYRDVDVRVALLTLLVLAAVLPRNSSARDVASCPRTPPSGQILGKPFPQSESWYGSESLAVVLPPDGIWRGMGAAHHYRNKLFWWSSGFRAGDESKLKVTAKRVDASSPPAEVSRATNAHAASLGGWAMLVLVEFPSAGCWQITGEYLGQRLEFVVEVPREDGRDTA